MLESDIEILPKKRKLIINLTSLIDVLFLLLIFFMVSSTFVKKNALKISLPEVSGESTQQNKNHIEITISKDGKIFINNIRCKKDAIKDAIQTIMKDKFHNKKAEVQFKVDKGVSYGLVIEIMGELKSLGINTIMAITKNK